MIKAKVIKTKSKQTEKIMKNFESLDGESVQIGYFDGDIHDGSGLTLASLATILEKGRDDDHIIARPIFEVTALENEPDTTIAVSRMIKKMIANLGRNDRQIPSDLDSIGEFYEKKIKEKFGRPSASGNRSNEPRTIQLKDGKDTPWVHDGELRDKLEVRNSKNKGS